MIRAILRKGKIELAEAVPKHWRDGQELTVDGGEPSDDPDEIKKWLGELKDGSALIPPEDHDRMAAAIREQKRQSKGRVHRR